MRIALSLSLLLAACGGGGSVTGQGDAAMSPAGDAAMGASTDMAGADLTIPVGGTCNTIPTTLAASQLRARNCGIGDDAHDLLHGTPYTKIVVEVAATAGATPRQSAIDHLVAELGTLCDKPGGVTVHLGDMNIAAPGHPLTIPDVIAIEDAHRTQFALGDTAVFFYLVVSDPSADDMSSFKILGEAYRASSMVVFQGSIDSVSGGLGQPTRDNVESTVVAHELGHVLGLVNISAPMVTPHEDGAHPKHDSNNACLMYYANNSSTGLTTLLTGGTVPDFDAQCKADLMALRNTP